MNPTDLTELRRLLDGASPRPWRNLTPLPEHTRAQTVISVLLDADPMVLTSEVAGAAFPNDADLIVTAVNALPELLDEIERLRGRLADVEALHSSFPLYTTPCEHDEDCNCIELSNGEYYEPDDHGPVCETCSGDLSCCDYWEHMTPWPCPTVRALRGES